MLPQHMPALLPVWWQTGYRRPSLCRPASICAFTTAAIAANFLEYFWGVITLRNGAATRDTNTVLSEDIFCLKFIELQCLFQRIRFNKLPKMDARLFDHFSIGDRSNTSFDVLFIHPFPNLCYSFVVFGYLFVSFKSEIYINPLCNPGCA